jgi:hypothetical protein
LSCEQLTIWLTIAQELFFDFFRPGSLPQGASGKWSPLAQAAASITDSACKDSTAQAAAKAGSVKHYASVGGRMENVCLTDFRIIAKSAPR